MTVIENIAAEITAIRDKWHTKNHPFFQMMLDGSLDLHPLGIYMASHYKFVELALPSCGARLQRVPPRFSSTFLNNHCRRVHGRDVLLLLLFFSYQRCNHVHYLIIA